MGQQLRPPQTTGAAEQNRVREISSVLHISFAFARSVLRPCACLGALWPALLGRSQDAGSVSFAPGPPLSIKQWPARRVQPSGTCRQATRRNIGTTSAKSGAKRPHRPRTHAPAYSVRPNTAKRVSPILTICSFSFSTETSSGLPCLKVNCNSRSHLLAERSRISVTECTKPLSGAPLLKPVTAKTGVAGGSQTCIGGETPLLPGNDGQKTGLPGRLPRPPA